MQITVTGKDNLGYSPKFGEIIKDQTYRIEEEDFADQLFNGPTPDYKPIWIRRAEEEAAAGEVIDDEPAVEAAQPSEQPAEDVATAETGGL